jgi:hypothetical protein
VTSSEKIVLRAGNFRLVIPNDCVLPNVDDAPGPMHACPGTLESVELDALGNESWRAYDGDYGDAVIQYMLVAALLEDTAGYAYRRRRDLEEFVLKHNQRHAPVVTMSLIDPPPSARPSPASIEKMVAPTPKSADQIAPVEDESDTYKGSFSEAADNEGARIASESSPDDGPPF